MTVTEFKEAVGRAGGHLPKPQIDRAVDFFIREIGTDRQHVRSCIVLAGQLSDAAASSARHEARPAVSLPPTAALEHMRRIWLAAYLPEVETLRSDLFGSRSAPFRDLASAAGWTEKQAKAQEEKFSIGGSPPELSGEAAGLKRDANRAASALARLTGISWSISPSMVHLRYAAPRQRGRTGVGRVLVRTGPLARVAAVAQRIARMGGFTEADAVAWILCGIEPTASRVRLSGLIAFDQVGSQELQAQRVAATFYLPNPTFRELRGLHQEIRDQWAELDSGREARNRNRPRLTKLDGELIEAVEAIGGVAEHPTASDWGRVRGWCRRQGYKVRSPEALRKHWKRVQDKLDRGAVPMAPASQREEDDDAS